LLERLPAAIGRAASSAEASNGSDDPRQAYTFPDTNENKLAFITAKGSRFLTDSALLGGNLYYRHYRNNNISSNVNDKP
jgi:hypothetical protein